MKRKRLFLLITLVCIMTIVTVLYYLEETKSIDVLATYMDEDWIVFSKEEGFYSESIDIKMKLNSTFPSTAKIYYTLDGSEPTTESSNYEEPITLTAGEKVQITTIRAVVAYKNELSKTYTKTYVMGIHSPSRYTTPVVSITANPEDLYSDERGILVPGKLFKDHVSETGYDGEAHFQLPANFNERWICPANITMFSPSGDCFINQGAGMYVGGNSARGMEQKTLIIDADEKFDEVHSRFEYIFDNRKESGEHSLLTSYGRLKLRNFSGDFHNSYLRGLLCAELAYEAGLISTVNIQPVVVYLNNVYYGLAELQPTYTPNYLGNLYGIEDKDKIEVYTGHESDLLELLGYPKDKAININDPNVRKDLEEKMDMDDLFRYYALEMIINNRDWPLNNVKAWRYIGDESIKNPYADGKYRFLLFDTDATFKLDPEADDIFNLLLYNDDPGDLWNFFYELMQYEPYKEKFVNHLLDLTATSCSTENMLEKAVEANQKMVIELAHLKNETSFDSVKKMLEQRDESVAFLLNAIKSRSSEITDFLRRYFDTYEQGYELKVEPPHTNCSIMVNTVDLYETDDAFVSTRYRNYPVTLQADIGKGRVFTGWRVNDTIHRNEELVLSEKMVTTDAVKVELITESITGDQPIIDRVSAKGTDDWIELYNPYENAIQLSDFCLSNKRDNLQKYHCPQIELESHETVRIHGKKSSILNSYLTNFSLRAEDTLYLYSVKDGKVIDSLFIPKMNESESYGRYCHTKQYQFFMEE